MIAIIDSLCFRKLVRCQSFKTLEETCKRNWERCSHTLEIVEMMRQSVFKDKGNHREVELMKINSELGENAHVLNNDS